MSEEWRWEISTEQQANIHNKKQTHFLSDVKTYVFMKPLISQNAII